MKKIQIIELIRTIKGSIIKFLSLILIISIGLSTYLGIRFAGQSMKETGSKYYKESYYNHLQVSYAYGLDEEDISHIEQVEDVSRVEGGYVTTGFLTLSEKELLVTIQAMSTQVNQTTLLEGRIPVKENEIAIERSLQEENQVQLGDVIAIDSSDPGGLSLLKESSFKVVGIVQHPEYVSNYEYGKRGTSNKGNGNCLNFVLTAKEAFHQEVLRGTYTKLYIWSDWVEEAKPFSKEYKERSQVLIDRIKVIGTQRTIEENTQEVKAQWIVTGRDANASYVMLNASIETIGKISMSFAFVFILVAAMVCYSSMSRMIHEQKIYIGTQKALGYRGGEILRKYLIYAALCVILGSYGGVFFAIYMVEDMTLNSYIPMYIFQGYQNVYNWKDIIIVFVAAILLMLTATVLACRKLIKSPTVHLLSRGTIDENKEMDIERTKWWRKRSLYTRSMLRNLMQDRRYVITTIIGVTGCTALMIIGFTLKFSIQDIIPEQFENILRYEMCLITSGKTEEEVQPYFDYLDQNTAISYVGVKEEMAVMRVNGQKYMSAGMIVSEQEDISEYFYMRDKKDGNLLAVPHSGAIVSSHLANYYGLRKGDYIEITDSYGINHPIEVVGFFDNYVNHYIVMSTEYYEEVFLKDSSVNTFYMKLGGEDIEEVRDDLMEIEHFAAFVNKDMGIEIFEGIADSIDAIIQIQIFMSAVMALVVVMNLSAMYIKEKERILAIMRINGFTLRETKRYIAKNNRIIVIIGLIAGVMLGILLGYSIVLAIENDTTCFVHRPSIKACVIGIGLGGSFAAIVNKIARRKINFMPLNQINSF